MPPTAKNRNKDELSRRILVTIKRDAMDTGVRVIWSHEFPILEHIHGEGNVKLVDPKTLDEGYSAKPTPDLMPYNKTQDMVKRPSDSVSLGHVFIGNPETEYHRLAAAYGRHEKVDMPIVEHIYGRFQEGRFDRLVSGAEMSDLPDQQLRELIVAQGYIPITTKDSTLEERQQAAAMQKELNALPRPKLIELADEMSVALA